MSISTSLSSSSSGGASLLLESKNSASLHEAQDPLKAEMLKIMKQIEATKDLVDRQELFLNLVSSHSEKERQYAVSSVMTFVALASWWAVTQNMTKTEFEEQFGFPRYRPETINFWLIYGEIFIELKNKCGLMNPDQLPSKEAQLKHLYKLVHKQYRVQVWRQLVSHVEKKYKLSSDDRSWTAAVDHEATSFFPSKVPSNMRRSPGNRRSKNSKKEQEEEEEEEEKGDEIQQDQERQEAQEKEEKNAETEEDQDKEQQNRKENRTEQKEPDEEEEQPLETQTFEKKSQTKSKQAESQEKQEAKG